ncbi:helix-hairpin-helix domain-containing protein, partial [Streptomyces decoyicus]|uniref:helix-hairpin-helix domain-containing protein n=1 Tax=Streptomyces decoyicus TaxID=249567 RepID=UPI00340BBAF5
MSTDRLAGETPPEQEAAPGTADAQTPEDTAAPGADASAPEDSATPGADATTPDGPAAPGEDATVSEPAPEPGAEAGTPDSGAARQPSVSASAKATADALAAAVRAVESGERPATSFFNDAPRPARQAAPAARSPKDTRDSGGSPAQGGPTGPVPEVARPRAAGEADGPARPPAADGGAVNPAGAAAPAGPSPAARPAMTTAPGIEGVRQVLAAGGAPETLAEPAAETLGERAAEALSEDPWQLLGVPGVRPEQADGFARALLGPACGPGDERRAQALVGWLLEQAAVAGHSALEAAALRAALAQRSVPDPDEALQTAIADGAVLVFQDPIEEPGRARPAAGDDEEEQPVRILLGLDRFAMAEESVADGLARLLNTFEAVAEPEQETAAEAEEPGDGTAAAQPAADGGPSAESASDPASEAGSAGAPADADDTPHRPARPSAAAQYQFGQPVVDVRGALDDRAAVTDDLV